MKVSVIMAARNTEQYLVECLDSIVDQTYDNWELIAVNDHSTDNTREVIAEYASKDSRIKVFDSKGHKLIPALQEGYRHATGDLINRMDSDDRMPPYKLETLVNEWLKYGKGTIIAGGTSHFVDNGEVGGGFLRYEKWLNEVARKGTYYQEIYKECVIPSHCWIIHRNDFEHAGGFNDEVYPEDYNLCFRFYEAKLKVVGIDKILHYWRDRPDRISRTWDEYKDVRYFPLKLNYFFKIDRDPNRPLVLWGAGKNGKDLAKELLPVETWFHWVCDNKNKIGKDVYGIVLEGLEIVNKLVNPQIIVAVASPPDKLLIKQQLESWNKKPVKDFWFFL